MESSEAESSVMFPLTRSVARAFGARVILSLGVSLGLTLLLGSACLSQRDEGVWGRGRILNVNVSKVQRVQEVAYTADGNNYVIQAQTPHNTLAVAKVLVRNDLSAEVSMLVDEQAVFLADRDLNRYGPLDPYTHRQVASQPSANGTEFLPFLWGNVEVPQGFQIEGWMIFEIPLEFEVTRLTWEQADNIWVNIGKLQ